MADYGNSRNYPPNHLSTGGGGTGLFWVFFAIAGLGILVLIGAFGGGSTTAEHPGGAGADPIIVPAEPAPLSTDDAVIIE